MGCISSNLSRAPSPQHSDPFAESLPSARPYSPQAEMGPGERLVHRNLSSVLKDTQKLVHEIDQRRNDLGQSIVSIEKKAYRFLKRIQNKIDGDMLLGSGADDYRQTLSGLRSELDQLIIATAESALQDSVLSTYEVGSTSTAHNFS